MRGRLVVVSPLPAVAELLELLALLFAELPLEPLLEPCELLVEAWEPVLPLPDEEELPLVDPVVLPPVAWLELAVASIITWARLAVPPSSK